MFALVDDTAAADWFVANGWEPQVVARALRVVESEGGAVRFPGDTDDAAPAICQAADWASYGFGAVEAHEWHTTARLRRPEFTAADAADWRHHGCTTEQAGAWTAAGVRDAEVAADCMAFGLSADDARNDRLWPRLAARKGPWDELFDSSRDAVTYANACRDAAEARRWLAAGWRPDEGLEVREWKSYGWDDPAVALTWQRAGEDLWTVKQADRLAQHGWTPEAALVAARGYTDPAERRLFLDRPTVPAPAPEPARAALPPDRRNRTVAVPGGGRRPAVYGRDTYPPTHGM